VGVSTAIGLYYKQVVPFEELLLSRVVQEEAFARLFVEKGLFTKEEFLEMVKVVDREMKKREELANGSLCRIL
jgi:hypothetical protein